MHRPRRPPRPPPASSRSDRSPACRGGDMNDISMLRGIRGPRHAHDAPGMHRCSHACKAGGLRLPGATPRGSVVRKGPERCEGSCRLRVRGSREVGGAAIGSDFPSRRGAGSPGSQNGSLGVEVRGCGNPATDFKCPTHGGQREGIPRGVQVVRCPRFAYQFGLVLSTDSPWSCPLNMAKIAYFPSRRPPLASTGRVSAAPSRDGRTL